MSGESVSADPSVILANDAPTVEIASVTNVTEDAAETVAGLVVATFTTNDEDGDTVTVALSDADSVNYAIVDGTVVLTAAGAALANSGEELPEFTLTPSDALVSGESVSADPSVILTNEDDTVVNNDSAVTSEDMSVVIDVLENDTDTDADGIKSPVISLSEPANGIVVINDDGTLKYTPNADFNGTDSFTYTNEEGQEATVNVTVDAVNDLTVVTNDTATTNEDAAIDIDVLANDDDSADGSDAAVSPVASVSQGANGIVTINDDGTVKYTPNADFNGTDSFTYTNAEGEEATVNVTITPQDDPTIIQISGSNSARGRVFEDSGNAQSVQGTFIFSDADYTDPEEYQPTSEFTSSTGGSEAIGNLTLTSNPTVNKPGQYQWEYVLNNEAAQYLDAEESIIEIYTVTINGEQTTVKIQIVGAEDPTDIIVDVSAGDSALGEVTEDNDIDGKLTVSGKLTFSDVDTTDSENFAPTVTLTNTTGTAQLGLLTINPDGTWNYEVDNTNSEIQALNSNETITETHTVNLNGTTQDIVITINGVDYAPVAVDDTEMSYETTIRLDELPQYGTMQVSVDGVWVDMVAGEEYASDSEVQFVPDEDAIKLNSLDMSIGSFGDDGSSSFVANLDDWGTVNSDGTAVTSTIGNATVTTSLITTDSDDSTILKAWNGNTHVGNGIGNEDNNGLSQGETLVIDIEGENVNEVSFTLDGLGSYFDESSSNATKVSITAYFEDGTSEIQSHYRTNSSYVDTYTFTFDKDSPIDHFELTTSGSNGTYVVQNMTLSRTVTDEITFTRTQADGSETTEVIALDLNHGDASEAVDVTNDLPAVDNAITEGVIFTDENSSIAIDLLSNDIDDDNDEITITEIAGQSVIDGGDAVDITVDGLIVGTGKLVDGKLVFTPSEELGVTLNDGDSKEIDIEYTISDGSKTGTAKATVRVDGVDDALTSDLGSIITGDEKDNTLTGGSGDDEIYGASGKDILNGGAGDDMLDGASGEDILNGGDGEDTLYGQSQNDTLNGGAGNDTLYGDTGDDTLNGDQGDDLLFGGSNKDTLNGGAGNDQLSGDGGQDELDGGSGDDTLTGGLGHDLLTGGAGIDTFVWTANDTNGTDTITDFNANEDKLDLSDLLQGESENTLGDYLDFSFDGKDTTITTYKEGGNAPTQKIVLEDTQLEGIDTDGVDSQGNVPDADKEIVINNLLNDGALIIGDTVIENTSTPLDDEIV